LLNAVHDLPSLKVPSVTQIMSDVRDGTAVVARPTYTIYIVPMYRQRIKFCHPLTNIETNWIHK